ncbi:hypothetical protein IAE22_31030, partial [Bacillus sp. S34]|nr:hypothetical protein [Bacillus sp. S34]
LTSVSSASGLTVTPSYDAGTFRVLGAGAGDHQLEYTVTDGTKTTSGIVRITILAPPDASTAPITTPKTVFVNTLSTKDTDVTATDIDPAALRARWHSVSDIAEATGLLVWTAGVKPNPLLDASDLPRGPKGHLAANAKLQVENEETHEVVPGVWG